MATQAQKTMRQAGVMNRSTCTVDLGGSATQANLDYTVQIPAGARNVTFRTNTTTAFGAVTDAKVSIGKTVGGAEYVAAVSVKAQGSVAHAPVAAGVPDLDLVPGATGSVTTLNVRLAQSGGNSAQGAAVLHIDYSLPV